MNVAAGTAAVLAAVFAGIAGLLTWEAVALSLSATAFAGSAVAIIVAGKALKNTEDFLVVQADQITAREQQAEG